MNTESTVRSFLLKHANLSRRLGILGLCAGVFVTTAVARERVLIDSGWRFQLGDPGDVTAAVTDYPEISYLPKLNVSDLDAETALQAGRPDPVATHAGEAVSFVLTSYDDSAWRRLDLPHDWAVELPFTNNTLLPLTSDTNKIIAHGDKPIHDPMFTTNNIGWYRRTFTLPSGDASKAVWLEFDGIYRNALIWLNGHCIGRNVSGYIGGHFDVTPYINPGGNNVLVVRVDATRAEGWFYEGAGIYRHVWLMKSDPVHVAHWGTFVATTSLVGSNATITLQTDVTNQSASTATGTLTSTVLDAGNNPVTNITSAISVPAGQHLVVTQVVAMAANLWSLDTPYLYNLVSTVTNQSVAADVYTTPFGVRTVVFDGVSGVLINGKHVEIQGQCNHQDHAGLGSALPDRLQYFRIELLKQMGVNAYRTSHNPPTPELLEACDRLGMLVLDETRRFGWDSETLGQLDRLIRRDRNHPSVFAWSLANEEWNFQATAQGASVIQTMQNLAHSLDSTRKCTAAIMGAYGGVGFDTVIDVAGFNYNLSSLTPSYHNTHPYIIGTELGSTLTTRGIYTNDAVNGYVQSYDIAYPTATWTSSAEDWWSLYYGYPWSSGGFNWTGFDYRGEPTPYYGGWPVINSHFGVMDMCGFPKDLFYYYQANWSPKPVLHIFPHWNWPTPGQNINVWAYGNCDAVELFLNGVSQGGLKTLNTLGHLQWTVAYAAGTLQAVGYRNGQPVLTNTVTTTGAAAKVALIPDRTTILADGRDVSVVTVAILDSQNRVVPTAMNLVSFSVTGGAIIGVGNGNPSSHEADKASSQRTVFSGLAQVIIQSTNQAGSISLTATSSGLASTNITLTAAASLPAPAAPSGVVAVVSTNGPVTISWDVVPGAISYNVKRATVSGGAYTIVASNVGTLGFTDRTLSDLTTYYYVVTAVSPDGESGGSAEVSATTHFPPAPAIPTGFAAIRGENQVSLNWTASSGAASYNVKFGTTPGGPYPTVMNTTATSLVVTGLVNDTPYYFVVSALNMANESVNSSQVSATPTAFVSGLTAAVAGSQIQLQWNAHAGATGYNVKRSLVSGGSYSTLAVNLGATNFTDSAVTTCQTYYYVVTMTLGSVESAPSAEISGMIPGPLPSTLLNGDVGSVAAAGSASYCGGQFTVTGSGADIWYSADAFQFVYVPLNGNGEIRARVAGVNFTDPSAKGGVMIRETLTAGSRHMLVDLKAGGGLETIWRTATGGSSSSGSASGTAPIWLRLTRTGSSFQAYYSANGSSWTTFGSARTINMATGVYIGLAVCSHTDGGLCTSLFDNVYISSMQTNVAPVLVSIGNRTIDVGSNLVVTATATDANTPAQTLAFSLLSAPANATLAQTNNTVTFKWRPFVTDAGTVNPVSVKVWDNGLPSLAATQNFNVTVNPLTMPSLTSASAAGGQFILQVSNNLVGPDYAVQVSSNLVNWSTQVITNSPGMPWIWVDTNAPALPAQFYRIKIGPPLP